MRPNRTIRCGIRPGNFPLLRKFGLSFDMQLFPRQTEHAVRLISDNPDILIVFTHAGMPMWRDAETMARWRSAIRRYAALPNTTMKISGSAAMIPTGAHKVSRRW